MHVRITTIINYNCNIHTFTSFVFKADMMENSTIIIPKIILQ